jgi:hypothetical protein
MDDSVRIGYFVYRSIKMHIEGSQGELYLDQLQRPHHQKKRRGHKNDDNSYLEWISGAASGIKIRALIQSA